MPCSNSANSPPRWPKTRRLSAIAPGLPERVGAVDAGELVLLADRAAGQRDQQVVDEALVGLGDERHVSGPANEKGITKLSGVGSPRAMASTSIVTVWRSSRPAAGRTSTLTTS